jgi:hypothetical protein
MQNLLYQSSQQQLSRHIVGKDRGNGVEQPLAVCSDSLREVIRLYSVCGHYVKDYKFLQFLHVQ